MSEVPEVQKMTQTNNNAAQPANFGDQVVGGVDLPKIDLDPFIGRDAKIELCEEFEGAYGPYVRLSTAVVEKIKKTGGDGMIELRASKVLGLVRVEKDGKQVIGWGNESKTAAFLKAKGVSHYRELVGKSVKIQTQTNKEGQTFLTF
ncbi:hypothetical protein [Candidatus Magnetobacterium casense]|uniref:Uncharacterized protein n=1 Tax=Candidatus Magnetobacterium casense TaxID=1455061 RepID=A0ABS6RWD5_9BACT|nr:hypothetical protein [Candidatus Magnetobacterium casensis]MBV6340344.1 hypothetical protein [Candidatus Magnetobacterium casensis]